MVLKVRTTDILAGGGVTAIGKGTRGAPALFLGLGVLIRCVCSNCEPSTNRTLMSCTLLANPLYFSKSLRKRKKKTESNLSKVTWWICLQNRVLNLDQNPQSYPGSLLVLQAKRTSVPQGSGSSPDGIPSHRGAWDPQPLAMFPAITSTRLTPNNISTSATCSQWLLTECLPCARHYSRRLACITEADSCLTFLATKEAFARLSLHHLNCGMFKVELSIEASLP